MPAVANIRCVVVGRDFGISWEYPAEGLCEEAQPWLDFVADAAFINLFFKSFSVATWLTGAPTSGCNICKSKWK